MKRHVYKSIIWLVHGVCEVDAHIRIGDAFASEWISPTIQIIVAFQTSGNENLPMHILGVFLFRIQEVLTVFTFFSTFLISRAQGATPSKIPPAKSASQNAWEKMDKVFVLYVAHSINSPYADARLCMCMHVHGSIH